MTDDPLVAALTDALRRFDWGDYGLDHLADVDDEVWRDLGVQLAAVARPLDEGS